MALPYLSRISDLPVKGCISRCSSWPSSFVVHPLAAIVEWPRHSN